MMKQVYPHSIQSGLSQSGSYILLLDEPESRRRIPIFIGAYEAQSIVLAKELIQTRRPMTHELMQHVFDDFGLSVARVTIDRVEEGIFYATLYVTDGFNEKRFDSRTSDAITLALQNACPIMVDEHVLDETGMPIAPSGDEPRSLADLEAELHRCEEEENYERAAVLQQQIDRLRANAPNRPDTHTNP